MARGRKVEAAGGADVLVVGGGPGGAAAAITCAAAGLQVILVERDPPGRDRPGETLHPGVEPLFARLGVKKEILSAGFLRHEGHWVTWSGPPRFEQFGGDGGCPWLGFQVWRAEFDAILLRRAHDLGVEIRRPCRVSGVLVERERVVGVSTPAGDVRARVVVDAAGRRHWLARELRIPIIEHSPRLIATYGYAVGSCAARDAAPSLAADVDGWTWTACVRPGTYAWTRLNLAGEKTESDWLPAELRGLSRRGRARAADVTWCVSARPAGPDFYLVGDAASVLDPASSHGVLKAIMSGIMAGDLISKTARGLVFEAQAARAYSEWIGNWFRHDTERLNNLYAIFRPRR